jgi:hypothetical protein
MMADLCRQSTFQVITTAVSPTIYTASPFNVPNCQHVFRRMHHGLADQTSGMPLCRTPFGVTRQDALLLTLTLLNDSNIDNTDNNNVTSTFFRYSFQTRTSSCVALLNPSPGCCPCSGPTSFDQRNEPASWWLSCLVRSRMMAGCSSANTAGVV